MQASVKEGNEKLQRDIEQNVREGNEKLQGELQSVKETRNCKGKYKV
jgi:hypothetical protein